MIVGRAFWTTLAVVLLLAGLALATVGCEGGEQSWRDSCKRGGGRVESGVKVEGRHRYKILACVKRGKVVSTYRIRELRRSE